MKRKDFITAEEVAAIYANIVASYDLEDFTEDAKCRERARLTAVDVADKIFSRIAGKKAIDDSPAGINRPLLEAAMTAYNDCRSPNHIDCLSAAVDAVKQAVLEGALSESDVPSVAVCAMDYRERFVVIQMPPDYAIAQGAVPQLIGKYRYLKAAENTCESCRAEWHQEFPDEEMPDRFIIVDMANEVWNKMPAEEMS